MAHVQDPKRAEFVRAHLPTLRERLAPLRAIDLILVSREEFGIVRVALEEGISL